MCRTSKLKLTVKMLRFIKLPILEAIPATVTSRLETNIAESVFRSANRTQHPVLLNLTVVCHGPDLTRTLILAGNICQLIEFSHDS